MGGASSQDLGTRALSLGSDFLTCGGGWGEPIRG